MKILGKYGVEETTGTIELTPNNNNGNVDFFEKMKIKDKELPCEMCGYMNCVCSLHRYRPQDFIEK